MLELLCDSNRKRAVTNLKSDGDKPLPAFSAGEVLDVYAANLLPLSEAISQRLWQPQDWTGWAVKAAIGQGFLLPLAGTWTITFTAQDATVQTTAALPYNATYTQVQTALNALSKIVAAGSVTVSGNTAGYFLVTFGNVGVQNIFTGSSSNLAPLSLLEPGMLIPGTAGAQCVQSLRIMQNPAAICDLSLDSTAAAITVDVLQVGGAGANHKVRVTLSPKPYEGGWTLIVGAAESAFIAFNAADTDVQSAVEAMSTVGVGNVSASKESDYTWLLMFIGAKASTDMGIIDGDATGIRCIPYRRGNLDLRTAAISLLFAGATSTTAVLEIEGTPAGGYPQKLLRMDVNLTDPIIDPTSLPAPLVPGFIGTNFRIKSDGTFQFQNEDNSKYSTVHMSGADGSVTFDPSQVSET